VGQAIPEKGPARALSGNRDSPQRPRDCPRGAAGHHLGGETRSYLRTGRLAPGRVHRHDAAPPVTGTSPPASSRGRSLTTRGR